MRLAFHDPGRNLRNAVRISFRVFVALLALSISEKFLSAAQAPSTAAPQKAAQPSAQKPASKTRAKPGSNTPGKSHSSKHSRSAGKSRTRERAQRAPTPERISEIQAALAGAGHYSGAPTGKWDASTVQAVKHYQQASGLPPTGKLDAHTLQKLGLGSPITGVSAPRPPATPPPAAPYPSTPPATPPLS